MGSCLEDDLQSGLPNAGIPRTSHISEVTWGDTPTRILELRVVKGVEELQPEFSWDSFGNARRFVEGDIPVIQARPVEETAVRIASNPQFFPGKWSGYEVLVVRCQSDLSQAYYQLSRVYAQLGQKEDSERALSTFNAFKKQEEDADTEFTEAVQKELQPAEPPSIRKIPVP